MYGILVPCCDSIFVQLELIGIAWDPIEPVKYSDHQVVMPVQFPSNPGGTWGVP